MRSNSHYFRHKDPIPEEARKSKDPTSNPYAPPFFAAKSSDNDPSTAPSLYDVAGQFLDPRRLAKSSQDPDHEEKQRQERLAHVVTDPVTKLKVISFPNAEDPQVKKAKDREEGRGANDARKRSHNGHHGETKSRTDRAREHRAKATDFSEDAQLSAELQEEYQRDFEELLPPTRHKIATSALSLPSPSEDIDEFVELAKAQILWIVIYMAGVSWLVSCFLTARHTLWIMPGLAYLTCAIITRRIDVIRLSTAWDSERKRGESFRQDESLPESIEWLNGFIAPLWPLINSELFVGLADTLEDVLQAQVPKVVYGVRVDRIDQGAISPRLLAVKLLHDALNKEDQRAFEEESTGEYVNVELSFAYVSKVTKRVSDASNHAHLLIYLTAGVKDVVGVDLPILVELKSVIGTMRARIELQPDPPFLRNATITLIGLPKFDVVVKPLKGFDVMDLPLVSTYVLNSLNIAASELVAPRSYTMNLGKLITGDTTQKDTQCIGIVVVSIHRGIDLRSEDIGGGSDPYVTISYARFGKPLFSTRVIVNELQPYWEETCFVRVSRDTVKEGESIRATLWDSDRFTADDALGKVEIDLYDLMRDTNQFKRRQDVLLPVHKGSDTQGTLDWSIGYFSKIRVELRETQDEQAAGIRLSKLDENPKLVTPRMRALQEEKACAQPYDKQWSSGILAINIESIRDMIILSNKRSNRRPRLAGRSHYSSNDPEKYPTPPQNGYVVVILNDEIIYRTRTKVNSNNPVFNAATEHFVRDIESARIILLVKCAVNRETDPIVGIVALRLRDLFVERSQVSRSWPLVGGVGFGHIELSFLWKPVEVQLPRQLRGYNVGLAQISSVIVKGVKLSSNAQLKLSSGEQRAIISGGHKEEDKSFKFKISEDEPLKIPVRARYPSNIVFTVESSGIVGRSLVGKAVLWLRNLIDSEVGTVIMSLYQSSDWNRLEQNTLTGLEGAADVRALLADLNSDREAKHHSEEDVERQFGLKRVGSVVIDVCFKPGMSLEHYDLAMGSKRMRDCFHAWEIASDTDDWRKSGTARAARYARENDKSAAGSLVAPTQEVIDDLIRHLKTSRKDSVEKEGQETNPGDDASVSAQQSLLDGSAIVESPSHDAMRHATPLRANSPARVSHSVSPFRQRDPGNHKRMSSKSTGLSSETTGSHWSTIDSDRDSHTLYEDDAHCEKKHARRRKHRRHTGAMQWSSVRSAMWLKNGIRHRVQGLVNRTKLKGRVPDIETEV